MRLVIVTYDICDPKRLRKVYRILKSYGQHLQLSVFRCDLTRSERLQLVAELRAVIHTSEDQVMFVDLGPTEGRAHRISFLGRESREGQYRGPKVF